MWWNNNYPYYSNGAMPDNLAQMRAQQMPMQAQASGLTWVLGVENAKSFPVAPNNTVALWDKESPTIYIKSVDAAGIPSMRIIEWKDKEPTQAQSNEGTALSFDPSKFITREEFETTIQKILNEKKGEKENAE